MKKGILAAAVAAAIVGALSGCGATHQPTIANFDQNTFGLVNEVQYAYVQAVHELRIEEDYNAPAQASPTDMRTRIVEAREYILHMEGGKEVSVVLKRSDPSIAVGDKVMVSESAGKIVRLSKY